MDKLSKWNGLNTVNQQVSSPKRTNHIIILIFCISGGLDHRHIEISYQDNCVYVLTLRMTWFFSSAKLPQVSQSQKVTFSSFIHFGSLRFLHSSQNNILSDISSPICMALIYYTSIRLSWHKN